MGLFEDIEDFLKQPALAVVPIQQRVQAFLADIYGAAWMSAEIVTYFLPGGEPVYVAFAQDSGATIMRIVTEREDGTLTLAAAAPSDAINDSGAVVFLAQTSRDLAESEARCLERIMPALIEAGQIVQQSSASTRQKRRIRRELAHASKHLYGHFQRMQ